MILFIYFWLCWVFSKCGELGLLSSCSTRASNCRGFSYCGAQALGHTGFSSCGSQAPELSSCSTRIQLVRGMQHLPRLGIKLMSFALAGEFFTTEPPGKPRDNFVCSESSLVFKPSNTLQNMFLRIYLRFSYNGLGGTFQKCGLPYCQKQKFDSYVLMMLIIIVLLERAIAILSYLYGVSQFHNISVTGRHFINIDVITQDIQSLSNSYKQLESEPG